MKKIDVLVQFSGGKDSTSTLIWVLKNSGFKKERIKAVFCDTGWEHDLTYQYVKYVCDTLNVELVVLKNKKYENGFEDMSIKKKRTPSTRARFCTTELKINPFIDYILDEVKNHFIVYQGIRHNESSRRSKMHRNCTYFKYYLEPYGYDKKKKPKYFTYRKKEILEFVKSNLHEIERPVIEWTAQQIIDYQIENEIQPNPLYKLGMSRVGCFPCIMTSKQELKHMLVMLPEIKEKLIEFEEKTSFAFFPPTYIPVRYRDLEIVTKSGQVKKIASAKAVFQYIQDSRLNTNDMFEPYESRSCMSSFNLCE